MGKTLFAQLNSDDGGMAVITICAHEFAHIRQMASSCHSALLIIDTTSRPLELYADYLAGYYMALRKREHGNLNLQKVGRTFYELGDTDFIAAASWNGAGTHQSDQRRL